MTNPWGIAAIIFAGVLIWFLINLLSQSPHRSHVHKIPPHHSNYHSVPPRETEWFSGWIYVPGSPGLYKARKWIMPGVMMDGSHCDASAFTFMLEWDGKRWMTLSGDLFEGWNFVFCGLTEKVPT